MAQALIFDIDGTLVDSVDLHAKAWQEGFAQFGYAIPLAEIRSQIGKGGDQLLPVFLKGDDLKENGERIEKAQSRVFKEKYFDQVKPFPGVRQLFQKAVANGQKVALASSAKGEDLKRYEQIAGIADLVTAESSSEDAEKSKPHPDIVEAALERLGPGIDHQEVIVIGDTPYDVEAARHAGLSAVAVRCGGFEDAVLRKAGPIAIYDGPQDLLEKFDSSPLAPVANRVNKSARSG